MHEDIIFIGDNNNNLEPVVIKKNKYTEIYNNINSIIYCHTDPGDIIINITNQTITFTCGEYYIEGQLFYILNSTYDKTNLLKINCYLRKYIIVHL
ncbi:hypothetical protein HZS_6573 [Henneguya salminicola]|nr:hypothetical protein HZS_6573 [Henneguya salminicola]